MSKIMPSEAAAQLNQIERILAHLQDDYALSEEDSLYLDKLNMVFKIIHGEEDRDLARKKITMQFGAGNHKKLIDDCTAVYGDFFIVNRVAMRIIQEKRHERVYEAAMRNQDYPAAERALKAIDQLYRLYEKNDDVPLGGRRLPKVKRTANPEALENIKANAKRD
jgi:hypothetical protein